MNAKTWVVSDLHFSHRAEFIWKNRGFHSWKEHDDYLLYKWNETVRSKDTVIILGDIVFQQGTRLDEILPLLQGHKKLILGNHEHHNMNKYVPYFTKIYSVLFTRRFIYSHVPVHPITLGERSGSNSQFINVHGHIHKNELHTHKHSIGPGYYNANLEFNDLNLTSVDKLNQYWEKIYKGK